MREPPTPYPPSYRKGMSTNRGQKPNSKTNHRNPSTATRSVHDTYTKLNLPSLYDNLPFFN